MESPKRGCDLGHLRSKTLAFKKRIAIAFCDFRGFPRGMRRFAIAFLSPRGPRHTKNSA